MAQLKVGAGRSEIVFPQELFPHEGFKGIHDNPPLFSLKHSAIFLPDQIFQ